jgi:response regulator of citrate/malate metabolism
MGVSTKGKTMTQQTQKPKIEVPKHDQKTKVPEPKPKPPKVTKKAIVEKLLKQDGGVTIEEVAEKTSWQHHTIRGHFSTIKKLGNEVIHTIRDGKRYY